MPSSSHFDDDDIVRGLHSTPFEAGNLLRSGFPSLPSSTFPLNNSSTTRCLLVSERSLIGLLQLVSARCS
jgi:hypothetical protein